MTPVYMDYNATTPVASEVASEMLPYITEYFGNPSSGHIYGAKTKDAVIRGRQQVADLLGCLPKEIVFTSGGSEADNLALKGIVYANKNPNGHIITSQIEHPAILNTCKSLEQQGYQVTYLPVDHTGTINPEDVRKAVTKDTVLITIMHANNEVGTIQSLSQIGEIAREQNICFHTDAAQSVGKIPTRVDELKVDLLTLAGHKFYGPKGIGALYVRSGINIEPLICGASQEGGLRAGTENVAGIVGLGKACQLAVQEMEQRVTEMTELGRLFYQLLAKGIPGVVLNGHPENKLPNTWNISFQGINAAELLAVVPEVAASTGSACHHGSQTLSPVLAAMGIEKERGMSSIRFSLGCETNREQVLHAAEIIIARVKNILGKEG